MNIYHPAPPYSPKAESMIKGMGGYPKSDSEIFLAAYTQLCGPDLDGGHALEICGGYGALAAEVARNNPTCKVTGLDVYIPNIQKDRQEVAALKNLEYVAGDAFDLSSFEDESLDLVWGQAALHHLAHNPDALSKEVARVLKPGGRLIFIFEPLGHNLLVAAIRAIRMARAELPDESNLYFSQFERMASHFSTVDVQVFNLLGYPMKALSDKFSALAEMAHTIDERLMRTFPSLTRYGANCNITFTK